MILVPNQPYPTLPAWEDVDGILENEWNVNIAGLVMRAFSTENTVNIFGRVHVGNTRIMGTLPERFRGTGTQGLTALVMKGPSCIVEVWGGGQVVMSNFSLGLTAAQMVAQYKGRQLFFSGSYPRKA